MDELNTPNLTLYITPTEMGRVNYSFSDQPDYDIDPDDIIDLIELKEDYPDGAAFLNSDLANELAELSDSEGVNITVHLYDDNEEEIACFDHWPNGEWGEY